MASQGISQLPRTGQGEALWGLVRRQQTQQFAFAASTKTPFSGNTPAGVIVYDSALNYAASETTSGTGELDLDHADGMQIIVSNNNSGQVLSGITLADYDLMPGSIAAPTQAYTTATNVATGASVTLSALNLASGSAVRLWVPINTASMRMWVANPTYAGAVTIGTGTFDVRVIPTYGSVRLTGRNTTLVAAFTALAITDTAVHTSSAIDVSGFANWSIIAYSTLNQSCTISLVDGGMLGANALRKATDTSIGTSIAGSSATVVITHADEAPIGSPLTKVRVTVVCAVAPTSGSISVSISGIPN